MSAHPDVEMCLLWIYDQEHNRATTVLRSGTADPADDDLANLPVTVINAMDGSEQYGDFRMDPVMLRCIATTRGQARALADVAIGMAAGPRWTPHGLIDGFTILDGPSREPSADDDLHEFRVQLGVETRPL